MKVGLAIPSGRSGAVAHRVAWDARPPRMSHAHRHDELEVNLIVEGRATYLMEGRRYELRRDSLLWLFPEQEHLLLVESDDFEMWIAVFRPKLVRAHVPAEPASTSDAPSLRASPPQTDSPRTTSSAVLCEMDPPGCFNRQLDELTSRRLGGLFARLFQGEGRWGKPENHPQTDDVWDNAHHAAGMAWLLLECWHAFELAQDIPAGAHLHPAVEKAARLLRDHPEMPDLEGLAKQVGLSPWWLSRLFLRQTGVSLTAFRNRQRVNRVIELIGRSGARNGRYTLTQAALAAGFNSYTHFYRVFQTHTGLSPSEFIRNEATRLYRVHGQG